MGRSHADPGGSAGRWRRGGAAPRHRAVGRGPHWRPGRDAICPLGKVRQRGAWHWAEGACSLLRRCFGTGLRALTASCRKVSRRRAGFVPDAEVYPCRRKLERVRVAPLLSHPGLKQGHPLRLSPSRSSWSARAQARLWHWSPAVGAEVVLVMPKPEMRGRKTAPVKAPSRLQRKGRLRPRSGSFRAAPFGSSSGRGGRPAATLAVAGMVSRPTPRLASGAENGTSTPQAGHRPELRRTAIKPRLAPRDGTGAARARLAQPNLMGMV